MHFEMRHHYAVTSRIIIESPIVVFMCAKRKREKQKKDREKSFSQGGETELDDD